MLYFSRWKTVLIWLVVGLGLLYAAPNLLPRDTVEQLPDWFPHKQLTLGLDLQGGVHLLLEVNREQIRTDRLQQGVDETRQALRDADIGYTGLAAVGDAVQVRIRNAEDIDNARQALNFLTQPINEGLFGGGTVREFDLDEPEPGFFRLVLTDDGVNYRLSSAVTQSVEVVRRRIDELGTTEPIIQRQGLDRLLVQAPGEADPERVKELIGQTAKLSFRMVDVTMPVQEALDGRPPIGTQILYSTDDPPIPYIIETRELVSGESLTDAQAGFDQRTNEPIVTFRFDSRGAQRFGQATQQNVGRPFAIVLDEQVISAPVIREPILGGTGQISGNFTPQTANDLAILLRAGALPADLTVIEERTVGPGLGADSIAAGEVAALVACVLVLAFMMLAYGKLGIIANIALIANIAMVIAALSVLGATLTLPGIAGIVLTVGMAVDSNVLIFERVREEKRQGRSLVQALDTGFQRALATIVDSNATTLIAAVILFYLGSGPVRGFAVTLAIGIITTVFTAFTLTRWMVAWWLKHSKPKDLPKSLITLVPSGTTIGFMRYRMVAFVLSASLSLGSLVAFGVQGMNYGIDFLGGSSIEIKARTGDANVGDVRSRLSELNLGDIQVQEFGSPQELLVRIATQEGDNAEQSALLRVRAELEEDYEFRRVEVVGPTVSSELAMAGTIAVITSLFAMLIYIWLRFEWQFGLGAITSTLHDVTMIIGLFVVVGLEFNLSSIAAILTVVGYSINDTVVVYDRVRENLRRYKKMPMVDLLDRSMNETLSRTVLTGFTTLLALGALFMFGGEVIASFTFAMIFGVIVGTYSSVFVAGPLLIFFKLRPGTVFVSNEDDGASDTTPGDSTAAARSGQA